MKEINDLNSIKHMKIIQEMSLMDDFLMNFVFNDDPKSVEELIRPILNIHDLKVISSVSQSLKQNTYGRDARFDIEAVDDKGRRYDIEIQRDNRYAIPERARYYSAMIDYHFMNHKRKNKKEEKDDNPFRKLPESYVIFFTERDFFKKGIPIYHIDRYVRDISYHPFDDRAHIIYVNCSYDKRGDHVGDIIHDLKQTDPSRILNSTLRNRVKLIKRDHQEGKYMSEAIEKVIEEEIAAVKEDSIRSAISLHRDFDPNADKETIVSKVSEKFSADRELVERLF